MELALLFGVGFSTGLSGAMIPGPLFLYTVSEAFRQGQWAGIKVTIGHLLLEACFVLIVVVGLRDWLASAAFRHVVAWVGGISLIVMGALVLRQVRGLSLARQARVTFRWGAVLGGAFFSVVSPGFILWWSTIGAAVLLQGMLKGTGGIVAVALGHAVADLLWYWLVALSIERGRTYCTDQVYRGIMGALACCLIVLGISLPLTQVMKGT